MKKFNRVAIIGVGLIGGSLGLAIRRKRLAREVVGVCKTPRSVRVAKKRGAIDWGTTDPVRAVQGSDFVIFATPIRTIPSLLRRLTAHLEPRSLVTDVASTKGALIMEIEKSLPKQVTFVGSHPMAGRETRGIDHAVPTLFERNVCFVIRRPRHSQASLQRVCTFWKRIGCRVKVVSAKEHDRLVASLSHLPHIIAALLVLNAERIELAGTGFKDLTRVASSDPLLWQDILFSNQREILRSLRHFRKKVDTLATLLEAKKVNAVLNQLKKAKRLRDRLVQ